VELTGAQLLPVEPNLSELSYLVSFRYTSVLQTDATKHTDCKGAFSILELKIETKYRTKFRFSVV